MSTDNTTTVAAPFHVRDCALITLATGVRAISLRELAEGVRRVELSSIYHHFWGRLLQPMFDEPEYNNDFASWAYWALHDKTAAERLSMIDPTEYGDIEELRQVLVDTIEARLDESGQQLWAPADSQFYFLQSQLVVLPTQHSVENPGELAGLLPTLPAGSIYYHFIDARRRTAASIDDFSVWLGESPGDHAALIDRLGGIDPFFSSLQHIRQMLAKIFREHFGGGAR